MLLLDMPPEILLCIAAQFESTADLNAFIQTCTHAYHVLDPLVYQHNCLHSGGSALFWAAINGREATAQKSLAAHRAVLSVDAAARAAEQMLFTAANFGQAAIVRLLLAVQGVDPDANKEAYGETPLMLAARLGHDGVVEELLATQAVDVNARDQWGGSPLLLAAARPHEAVVRRLLATPGVDPRVVDRDGWTALTRVANHGHAALVELILATTQEVDTDVYAGDKAMIQAALAGHEGVVQVLLRSGAVDIEAVDQHAQTALAMAAWSGHAGTVKLLLAAGASPDVNDSWGDTPLSKAVRRGWVDVVKIMLAVERVDCNSQDLHGRTPLSRAAENGDFEVVQLLLAAGADPNLADDQGKSSVDWAKGY